MTREKIIDKIHGFLLTHHANVECDTCINVFKDLRSLIDEIKTDKYPENHWHSVADGDLPKEANDDAIDPPFLVRSRDGNTFMAYYGCGKEDGEMNFFDDCGFALAVDYWMEIPKLPTE